MSHKMRTRVSILLAALSLFLAFFCTITPTYGQYQTKVTYTAPDQPESKPEVSEPSPDEESEIPVKEDIIFTWEIVPTIDNENTDTPDSLKTGDNSQCFWMFFVIPLMLIVAVISYLLYKKRGEKDEQ